MYYYHEPPITEEIQNKINNFNALTNRLERSFSKVSKVDLPEGLRIDYENKLNARQLEAVTHINGPLLVIAGAGTGKTHTLVYRVAYMIENGISPNNILLLTFTKNAAREMLKKVQSVIGDKYNTNNIAGGTFHSFANMIIRENPTVFGINRNFTILDVPDCKDTIELVRKSIDTSAIDKEPPDKKLLQKIISVSKSSLISINEAVNREIPKSEFKWYFNKAYEFYEDYKLKHEQLDFDDLLLVLLKKLKENKDFKECLQDTYKYILVDEFQDTNIVQNQIITELADKYSNIMAVGDDSQSIYSFRGANVENILLFPEKYPECKLIKLEENYRSQSNILNLANEITNQFKIGYRKKLFSSLYRDWLPKVVLAYNDKIQAQIIIEMLNDIKGLEKENYRLNDVAVLFRDSYHSNVLQMHLNQAKIKYRLFGGLKFNERKHIKDIVAHLKVIFNPFDKVAWNRVLKLIPNIGEKTASKIIDTIIENNGKLDSALFSGSTYYEDLVLLQEIYKKNIFDQYNFNEILEKICAYYQTILKVIDDDYESREEDIKSLLSIAKSYSDLTSFLADFSLNPPDANKNESSDALTLSTVHSAKGLEWKYVFILHVNEDHFPNKRALESFSKLEEEKRLFYVACTRAKVQLLIFIPAFGSFPKKLPSIASRFIGSLLPTVYKLESGSQMLRRLLKLGQ